MARNPRDAITVTNIAKQMFPGKFTYATEAYADATKDAHSFALFDVSANGRRQEDNRIFCVSSQAHDCMLAKVKKVKKIVHIKNDVWRKKV